ncbi:Retrovirus-related Pol polyprotein from transposon TNT 1-94 [Araneus ventricosus]|uniref:Retrovirus-related Pol polyprotein from transposon TNT 1-94 n=1 Tax=Araneus ventricosus TaxID=182803 RepID=A0A4Y2EU24_ARAVE|nr:Retrovirus-related Pol polyprotein from transposon TNT 1-94 [Araneus ventricosus]
MDCKSTSGYVIFLGDAPVSWSTLKQNCTALSSMEAEYIALSESVKEIVWLNRIMNSCLFLELPVIKSKIFCDNQSAIYYSKNLMENQRTKHIDNRYFFVKEKLNAEEFDLLYVSDDAEAWRILKNHFEPTTRARVIQLLDEFFNTRCETGEALGLFLCCVKQGAERLQVVGHQLQPLYQGYQMIRSLPAEYESIVQAIYRWTDTEFQPDKIEGELLLEENRLQLTRKDLDIVSSIAFSNEMHRKEAGNCYKQDEKLKTRRSKVKRFKTKISNVKNKLIDPCYFCKSYGHLIANCKHKAALSNPKTSESNNTEFKVKSAFSRA